MEGLKRYLIENFEQIFVLFILLSVAGITYFIPYKLAFLNFYFIPILLAAYYLGVRKVPTSSLTTRKGISSSFSCNSSRARMASN